MTEEEQAKIIEANSEKKGNAMIAQKGLDDESSYSHVFLTAVYHDDLEELRQVLKKKFYEINSKVVPEEEKEGEEDKSFGEEWDQLALEEVEDKDKEDLEEAKKEEETKKKDLFLYSVSVMLLSAFVQLSFIITIIQEYFGEEHQNTSDPEEISIRIICFITLAIYLWIELQNGRKIFNHACYHAYLYRTTAKRITAAVGGLLQCGIALCTLFCSSELICQSGGVADCVTSFTSLVIITDIDNWIGAYLVGTSKDFKIYTADRVEQIYVLRKDKYFSYTFALVFVDLCSFAVLILSVISLWNAIDF